VTKPSQRQGVLEEETAPAAPHLHLLFPTQLGGIRCTNEAVQKQSQSVHERPPCVVTLEAIAEA